MRLWAGHHFQTACFFWSWEGKTQVEKVVAPRRTHLHSGIKIVELFGFISEDPTLCMCAYVHESAATEYGSVCPILME